MPQLHLTDLSVRGLKGSAKNEKFFDTKLPGFGIRVGIRQKTFVVMRGRNRELITIGHYPAMSLSDARAEAKKLLSSDPQPKGKRITFKEAAEEFLKDNYADTTSDWPYIVRVTLGKHAQGLEGRQLAQITDTDISALLKAIPGHSARLHFFRILRTFFKWATRPPRRYLPHSPIEGYEPPGTDKKRSRILTDDELKSVWNAAGEGSKRIFRLLILWGTRSAETAVLQQAWLRETVLTIPGAFTKNGRDHAIPMLPLAEEVLNGSRAGQFYFPGRRSDDASIQPGSLHELRRDIQKESGTSNWGAHDLRRTFRSNMARLKVPRDLCEILLNHAPATLDEIYDRYTYLEEKRDALSRYEEFMVKLIR